MIALAVAMLAAFLQREFLEAVATRDRVRSLLAQRSEQLRPELTVTQALRGDAAYYLRQLRRRQPEPDIERKRLFAMVGVAVAIGCLVWILFWPS